MSRERCRSVKSDYESNQFVSAIEDYEDLRKLFEDDEKKDAIIEMARKFKPHTDLSDDYRLPGVHKDGGFPLTDAAVLERYRSAFKDIASQIGRSIFTGRFNLGSVSFPIKCMSHRSILEMVTTMSIHSPTYMNAACYTKDPVERMRLVMTTSLSFIY